MQSLPKLITTVVSGGSGAILISAPLNSMIRLYECKITVQNNITVPIAGVVSMGVFYFTKNSVFTEIYEYQFLPAIAITNIPGSNRMITNFGPTGLLCYPQNILSQASVFSALSQTLSGPVAYTLLYNIEPMDS